MQVSRSWAVPVARVITVVALAAAVFRLAQIPYDDAFIHLRVAHNLAFHGEPYFNLGERVMADSSPLWVLLLAGSFKILGASTLPVAALGALSVAALLLLTERVLALSGHRAPALGLGVAAGLVATLALVETGFLMESALALALALGAVFALARGRPALAGVCCALAAATRFEMVLLALALFLAAQGRARWRFVAGLVPISVLEGVLLLTTYGTVIPNTVRAKSVIYPLSFEEFLFFIPTLGTSRLAAFVALLSAGAIMALFSFRLIRSARAGIEPSWEASLLALAGFGLAVLCGYAVRRVFMFPWYWPIVVYPLGVSAATLALLRRERLPSPADRRLQLLVVGWTAVALSPFIVTSVTALLGVFRGGPLHAESTAPNLRCISYQEIGRELMRDCPGAVVMAPEIGALGWAFQGRIVDGVGLASPEILRHHPLQIPEQRQSAFDGAMPGAAIAEHRPDFVVAMEQFATDVERLHGTGAPGVADYQLHRKVPVAIEHGRERPIWRSRYILVLRRPDACSSKPAAAR